MDKLTPRQLEIYYLIKEYMKETGSPPTRAEIARDLGFRSANAAEEHLRALARKGYIDLVPGASRGIRILSEEPEGVPLVGKVAAGFPILSEEYIEKRYTIPADMFTPQADFLLEVRGMSMKNAGILDGDLLAVHQTADVRKNQIVVARVNHDEVTVKRFEKKGNIVYLHPENEDFETIQVDLNSEPFEIEGIAVGVIRSRL
ncbi:MAG: transcriptional repressor LexA [Gammaproteobacteria bacterium]|nr:transcriptional repressor LexA [Gammaproteobacteria bacterium]